MIGSATRRWAVALLFGATAAPTAWAQQPSLGDEFIFFVNGTNILVPNSQALVVNDPLAPTSGNKVARFNTGDYSHQGFYWPQQQGVDMTGMVSETAGEGDTLFFRMLSDPANATEPNVTISFTDKTNVSGATDGSADNEFRAQWRVPASAHDGQWHSYAIPLPPRTSAALETARANGALDGLDSLWTYAGAWSPGGFGISPGFGGTTADPLWREFEWNAVYKFGPWWDNNAPGGGPIYLDDIYIGGPGENLVAAGGTPAAMSGVTFAADGTVNRVSWGSNSGFGGYNVYASLAPITDVTAPGVLLLKSVRFDEALELVHRYEVPHPAFGDMPVYYAVTSLSQFGVENPNVSASSGSVTNPNLPDRAYIRQLTSAQADAAFDAVASQVVTDPFPADQPVFVMGPSH